MMWYGELPEKWEAHRLKHSYKEIGEYSPKQRYAIVS